ncbi:MAG: SDR family NAD(P)-dependent oxidoreductase [Deltaproteobacteria bacterium]|nr:SDR family NAD(P)-dependent oxidoreductase [Deltaproteobacteria bacterium]
MMGFLPLKKLPLGGIDRRAIAQNIAEQGPAVAAEDLRADVARTNKQHAALGANECVLILGGSQGLGRAMAVQLLFGERANVFCVHYDSERLQIGAQHVKAIRALAATEHLQASFMNADATDPKVVESVITALRAGYETVHLWNGIAAGAPKRFAEHGPIQVLDLDVAYDPVRQIADMAQVRGIGLVDVDVASQQDIDKTHRLMGTSTELWTDALAAAGLLTRGRSVVAFADYDFEPDNPVYGMGPLASAKKLQRKSMIAIREKHGARTVRVCYPAMNTTAIGAIPGGLLTFAGTWKKLAEHKEQADIHTLAARSMVMWHPQFSMSELRLDTAYQLALAAFSREAAALTPDNWRERLFA